MDQDLVSVIMPTYNTGKVLSDSIDSILNQSYPYFELLITDDGSTDPYTIDLLKQYETKDSRIKVNYLSYNVGPAIARNKSIERAQGRYIAFCDSDDRWTPDKLEKQIAFMKKKQCALCSSSYFIVDSGNNIIGIYRSPQIITYGMYKRDNKIGCLTAIYDTHLLGKKYNMPTTRKRQDWGLFLNILKASKKCCAITEPLAYYRKRNNSLSSNKRSLVKYNINIYKQVLGFSSIKAYLYFIFLFLPTYFLKIMKVRWDSYRYLTGRR
ncbi:MAG: glycosyltransferase family 2 protein [Prevotella sp.]|jgi:teichuronic acid biosynthesis glycosyltransferase TuaG